MFDTKSQHRLGNDGFYWWYGVVEDIDDKLKLGRVRVRILGDHTQSKKQNRIPTESLPWAYPINNIHSASMNGIGKSPTGIALGSWCFGFYSDGIDKQQPIILGSFGGIPEAIAWNPEKATEEFDNSDEKIEVSIGFQDPTGKFPLGHMIFEQDTNRLARGAEEGAIEVPESLVPPIEKETDDGLCPSGPKFAIQYHDKFDEKYVKKYAKGEKDQQVEKKDDKQPQYKLKNNHPFTVFKFVKRERRIPIAKPFADQSHRDEWNEPQNPYAAKYPYNHVTEFTHGEGKDDIYGYDQTITGYDGSEKEGLHRKQKCGEGAWGLGEEWDTTEGAQRYHRFHPKGNYFEIDNNGNQVDKIYGDGYEINLKDRYILIKGDWNITVEGDKNELIEGDYNLQVIGDFNTDVRGDIKTHTDQNYDLHVREDSKHTVDGDEEVLIAGNRNTSVLVKDYHESQIAERHADTIIRKGATSIEDEGFMTFDMKAHEMNVNICTLNTKAETHNEIVETYNGEFKYFNIKREEYTDKRNTYEGYIKDYILHTDNYLLTFDNSYEVLQETFVCTECEKPNIFPYIMSDILGKTSYCANECINNQCKPEYHSCIEDAKSACTTTLINPRTGESETRIDWEKYHASMESCKQSYDNCEAACEGCAETEICSPTTQGKSWECTPSHDPRCPLGDKEIQKVGCAGTPILIDPWENAPQEKP